MSTNANPAGKFQREDRYIVIKRSDLKKVPVSYRSALVDPMFSLLAHLPNRECLVIESDWPEFEPVWAAIEARVTDKATEQHQGEPVSLPACKARLSESHDWDQGYRGGWKACLDEIAKLGPLYTRPAQGDVVGWQFYQQGKWWNGDDRIKDHRKNTEAAGIPTRDVYTHVDPAEVERLRCEVSKWRGKAGRLTHERDGARAQLAERDALLRMVYLDEGTTDEKCARVEQIISASAETSAPAWSCQSCQLEQPTDRPCDVCGGRTEPVATKS